jgi:predicted nucleotidyltransferase component of viral defense system
MFEPDIPIEYVPTDIDLETWVEAAKADPVLHRARQVTEIALNAVGLAPSLKTSLILKGGTLMAIAFHSIRLTGDVDFTASVEPEGFEELLKKELDPALEKAAQQLGYLDLVCRIQGIKKLPRSEGFAEHKFPALQVTIASAKRGTQQEENLHKGRAAQVVNLEISFRDQVYKSQELSLAGAGVSVQSFTLTELIAEKLRALLQQKIRHRNRRQDVYDIAFLLERFIFTGGDKALILQTFKSKCLSRNITPERDSIEDPELVARAHQDWDTLRQEIGALPSFDGCYALVKDFYESLPW